MAHVKQWIEPPDRDRYQFALNICLGNHEEAAQDALAMAQFQQVVSPI